MLAHSPRIVTDGLVLCLDAANPKSYPGTGTTWFDLSGRGNHVTLYNTPIFQNKKFTFDGVNEYAKTTNSIDLSNTNAITVIHLFKVLSYSSLSIVHELSNNFNSYSDAFVASYSDNSVSQNNEIFASLKGNVNYNVAVYDKTLLNDLNWHHFCVVHNTTETSKENLIYTDSSLKNELFNPLSGYGNNNTNNFGNRELFFYSRGGTSFFCNIEVSYVALYNRALSANEIQQNFVALRGRYGI